MRDQQKPRFLLGQGNPEAPEAQGESLEEEAVVSTAAVAADTAAVAEEQVGAVAVVAELLVELVAWQHWRERHRVS